MTNQPIYFNESGMRFGPYHKDQVFDIEHSRLYASISHADVKTVEFVFLRNDSSLTFEVVEAKSSAPKETDEFTREIREKFVNTITLCWATVLKRHPRFHEELPLRIREMNLPQVRVRLILVIKNHQWDWLPPVQDALRKAMRSTMKTWGFLHDDVLVFNEEMARQKQYIV